MEIIRTCLRVALLCTLFGVWNAWKHDYLAAKVAFKVHSEIDSSTQIAPEYQKPIPQEVQGTSTSTVDSYIHFQTDKFKGVIDRQGGRLVELSLLDYPNDQENGPFKLLDQTAARYYIAQTDIQNLNESDVQMSEVLYTSPYQNYVLSADQQTLQISLQWQDQNHRVIKQFVLKRGEYQISINYQLYNQADTPWKAQLYAQLQRQNPTTHKHFLNFLPAPYQGGTISTTTQAYEKLPFEKMGSRSSTQAAWIALVEPYFLSAWIPEQGAKPFQLYTKVSGDVYYLGVLGPVLDIKPNHMRETSIKLYAGPTIIEQLKAAAPHLELNVDYGILRFIAVSLLWLLKQLHQWVGNWGWAIVLLAVLQKLAFYNVSFRSARAFYTFQSKLQEIEERYGNDTQKLKQAKKKLYQQNGSSLLAHMGFQVIQAAIALALFWVLLENVELRHAPFILWIRDLSAVDPYVLPLLMGASVALPAILPTLQSNAKLGESIQEAQLIKGLLITACVMVFARNFSAGVLLNWIVSNLLSVLQECWKKRYFDTQAKAIR